VKVFRDYGLSPAQMEPIVRAITSDQSRWVDFMMRFELGLEEPDPARAGRSAGTIAASYIVGGLIPLAPYILMEHISTALWVSVGVTLLALLVFGSIKGYYTGVKPWRAGAQTAFVGGLAAAAAFFIARLIR
jgi:vacuolar iron transporter family protein